MGYAVIGFAAAIVVLAAAALILAILIYRQERKARGMLYGDRGGAAQEPSGRGSAQAGTESAGRREYEGSTGPLPEEYEYDAPPRTRREEQKYDSPPGGGAPRPAPKPKVDEPVPTGITDTIEDIDDLI